PKCAGANIVCYNSRDFRPLESETHGSSEESWKEEREKRQASVQKNSAEALRIIVARTARIRHPRGDDSRHRARAEGRALAGRADGDHGRRGKHFSGGE